MVKELKFEDLKNFLELQDRQDLTGVKLYNGFVFEEQNFFYDGTMGKIGFIYIDGFLCEPYLQIWVNPEKMATFEYCEVIYP
jgi:hypothetical protein